MIGNCQTCLEVRSRSHQKEPLIPHERPQRPWAKVGINLFALGRWHYLVTVDCWSNYFVLDKLEETDSHSIIRCLRRHFASHGIPDEVVTDNGPQFISKSFAEFTRKWMFKHVKTSPYYSQANGMAESAIKTANTLLRSAIASGQNAWMDLP